MNKLLIAVVLLVLVGVGSTSAYADTYPIKMTVHSKFIDTEQKTSHYLVIGNSTNNGNISLEIDRIPWTWDMTNIDISYGTIEVNKTYSFNCWGIYNAFLQWYPICNTHTP